MKWVIVVALSIAFAAMKLTHTIGWSWWAVTAPLWGNLTLIGACAQGIEWFAPTRQRSGAAK